MQVGPRFPAARGWAISVAGIGPVGRCGGRACGQAPSWPVMGTLPFLLADPLTGIVLAAMICAFGGGLLEIRVSPVVEACPTTNKAFHMSLPHSFYCWGMSRSSC